MVAVKSYPVVILIEILLHRMEENILVGNVLIEKRARSMLRTMRRTIVERRMTSLEIDTV